MGKNSGKCYVLVNITPIVVFVFTIPEKNDTGPFVDQSNSIILLYLVIELLTKHNHEPLR